jgi:hypothetical protein
MYIIDSSAYPSINAWSRTFAYGTFQSHELFLQYLRWLDQSYGSTVTGELHDDRHVTIGIHGIDQLSLVVAQGRVSVRWLHPDAGYWAVLSKAVSKSGDVTQAPDGAWGQFFVDTKQDGYLLRDLTCHLHR